MRTIESENHRIATLICHQRNYTVGNAVEYAIRRQKESVRPMTKEQFKAAVMKDKGIEE